MIAFIIVCIVLLGITVLLDLACVIAGDDGFGALGLIQLFVKIPTIVALSILLGYA